MYLKKNIENSDGYFVSLQIDFQTVVLIQIEQYFFQIKLFLNKNHSLKIHLR